MKTIILICVVFAFVRSENFPSYITPCKITDESCIIKNGNVALKTLVFGDEAFGVPVLTPILELKEVKVDLKPNFYLLHTDIKMKSLSNFEIIGSKFDKNQNKLSLTLCNPSNDVDTAYDINVSDFVGKNINGKGTFELNIINSTYIIDYYLKTINKESTEYYALDKVTIDFFPEKVNFKFANLFDGDIAKTKEANLHIDTHWREFLAEVKGVYNGVMGKLVETVFNAYTSKVPKNKFFLS